MTLTRFEACGYLIVHSRTGAVDPLIERVLQTLVTSGWRLQLDSIDCRIFVGPRCAWPVAQVHRRHALIGEWRGDGAHPSAMAGRCAAGRSFAAELIHGGWGAYLMVWVDDQGRLNLVRDPSGAIDAVWWTYGGVTLVSDRPPTALDPVLPERLAVDWERLGEILRRPSLMTDGLALKGFNEVGAGCWTQTSDPHADETLWRPQAFARQPVDDAPEALSKVVDRTVDRLVRGRRRVLAELSGGLDSAIVASSLKATGHLSRARFINYYGDDAEGDERAYATAAAERLETTVEAVRKPVTALIAKQLEPLGWGVRPALQGVDVAYDRDSSGRLGRMAAQGLLTGQGGDSVFFQAPDPHVAADRLRREGLAALRPTYLAAVGRWTRRSAWTVGRIALRPSVSALTGPVHRWLADIRDLPPAKRGQIERLVNCQLFWTDCLRARAAPLLNPLLSQPVVEHCLGVPADRLVQGPRDRGLARLAFADRLPAAILHRRDKGDLSNFYGRLVIECLPTLRELLIDGRLVQAGVLDRDALIRDLDADRLLWSEGSNQPLLAAVLETWARHWEDRIRRRRTKVTAEPIQDASMQIS